MKLSHKEILDRIGAVRRSLMDRGFLCLSGGKFGLPSYTHVEAWANSGVVVYLLYDNTTGGWDILHQLDATNTIDATWAALDALMAEPEDERLRRLPGEAPTGEAEAVRLCYYARSTLGSVKQLFVDGKISTTEYLLAVDRVCRRLEIAAPGKEDLTPPATPGTLPPANEGSVRRDS